MGSTASQRDIFLASEGDAWFERNRRVLETAADPVSDPVLSAINALKISGASVLEIGCSSGYRLAAIPPGQFSRRCGIDPSAKAIELGRQNFAGIELSVGTGDQLSFEAGCFDLVIFGFCLYLCDPGDLFKIAAEADRVVAPNGYIAIYDFSPGRPYRRAYSHHSGVNTHKMFFPAMFLWHPCFTLVSHRIFDHADKTKLPVAEDDAVAVSILKKDSDFGWPMRDRAE